MQLSPQNIRSMCEGPRPLIEPFRESYKHKVGLSGGLSCAGYDIHLGNGMKVPMKGDVPLFGSTFEYSNGVYQIAPRTGVLAVTEEKFNLRNDMAMHYYNKSSLARVFINAAATLGEPGWHDHLTLEIYNQTDRVMELHEGQPIGQVVFILLDVPSDSPYVGKYQGQGAKPVEAR